MAEWSEKCLTCRKHNAIPLLDMMWACYESECNYEPYDESHTITITTTSEEGLTMAEYNYQKSIDCAMRHITVARDNFAHHYNEEFDIDWAMEQFNYALDILERLRGYAPPEWEG